MKDLYGYKEKDVAGLMEFIEKNPAVKKSEIFSSYAKKSKKAEGTVRNMYYAMVKAGKTDENFKQGYLGGKEFSIKEITPFSEKEERKLIKDILLLKRVGNSVRKAVNLLAKGDSKLALRYQNKYRNALSVKPEFVDEIVKEINMEKGETVNYLQKPHTDKIQKKRINELQLRRLKIEIDALVSRIADNVKTENDYLKRKIALLESENERLFSAYAKAREDNPLKKFHLKEDENALN